MTKNIFLLKVNPEHWKWGNELNNWDDLKKNADVSFDGNCKYHEDIKSIKLHDIFLGYNMDCKQKSIERNKAIVCIGRIISDGCFISVGQLEENNERFLVQKIITLEKPIELSWMKNKRLDLGANQPTVKKLKQEDWEKIKRKIISKEPKHEKIIKKMESNSNDLWID